MWFAQPDLNWTKRLWHVMLGGAWAAASMVCVVWGVLIAYAVGTNPLWGIGLFPFLIMFVVLLAVPGAVLGMVIGALVSFCRHRWQSVMVAAVPTVVFCCFQFTWRDCFTPDVAFLGAVWMAGGLGGRVTMRAWPGVAKWNRADVLTFCGLAVVGILGMLMLDRC